MSLKVRLPILFSGIFSLCLAGSFGGGSALAELKCYIQDSRGNTVEVTCTAEMKERRNRIYDVKSIFEKSAPIAAPAPDPDFGDRHMSPFPGAIGISPYEEARWFPMNLLTASGKDRASVAINQPGVITVYNNRKRGTKPQSVNIVPRGGGPETLMVVESILDVMHEGLRTFEMVTAPSSKQVIINWDNWLQYQWADRGGLEIGISAAIQSLFTLTGDLFEKCSGTSDGTTIVCTFNKWDRSPLLESGSTATDSPDKPSIPLCEDIVKDVGVGRTVTFSVADAHCQLPEGQTASTVHIQVVSKSLGLDGGIERRNPYTGEIQYEAKQNGEGLYDEMEAYVVTSDGISSLPFRLFARHRYAPDCKPTDTREVVRSTEIKIDRKDLCPDKDIDQFSDLSGDAVKVEILDPATHGAAWFDEAANVLHYRSFYNYVGEDRLKLRVTDRFGLSSESEVKFNVTDVTPTCFNTGAYTPHDTQVTIGFNCTLVTPEPIVFLRPLEFRVEPTDVPEHGKLGPINQLARTVEYTPDPGFIGRDVFTYTAENNGAKRTAQAVIVVNP